MTNYQQNYLQKRRLAAKKYLGNQCVVCGTVNNLEFDHIDPSTKLIDISTAIAKHYAWIKLCEELDKCQLLCVDHHLEKTSKQSRTYTHSYWMYRKYKCRCDVCIQANSEYLKKFKKPAKRHHSKEWIHGTRACYLKELRAKQTPCDLCKQANTNYSKGV